MPKVKDIDKIRERKKGRKKVLRSVIASEKPEVGTIELRQFKRSDKLIGCNEALELYFKPAEGDYFRVVHNPPEVNDQLVQSEQHFEGLAPTMTDIPDTIAPDSNLDDQFDHIADWSLSFNIDEHLLAKNYWAGYDRRRNEAQKQKYVTRKGDVIALYRFTPRAGYIQRKPDDDGHVVLVEFDDFVLEDYRVKEFVLQPLTVYKNEQ